MAFTIRQAGTDDTADIGFVPVESWKTTYSGIVPGAYLASLCKETRAQKWRERLVPGDPLVFVAEDESGIFGFVSGGKSREAASDYDCELYAIYLLRQRQRQRVGHRLTSTLADHLRSRGFNSMLVWVLEQNPAVRFYQRLGAIQVAKKSIEIGGVQLPELALGWPSLHQLAPQ